MAELRIYRIGHAVPFAMGFHKGGAPMLCKVSSPLARLWVRLPVWFGRIESVRVGNDTVSFVRITLF